MESIDFDFVSFLETRSNFIFDYYLSPESYSIVKEL